jgi:hypothetical protein
VTRDQVAANKYDLSASRYRQVEQEEVFYEQPAVTLERMRQLEQTAERDVTALAQMLNNPDPKSTKDNRPERTKDDSPGQRPG